jgi:hypothetical protein
VPYIFQGNSRVPYNLQTVSPTTYTVRSPSIVQSPAIGTRPIGPVAEVKAVYFKDSDGVVKKLEKGYVKDSQGTVRKIHTGIPFAQLSN